MQTKSVHRFPSTSEMYAPSKATLCPYAHTTGELQAKVLGERQLCKLTSSVVPISPAISGPVRGGPSLVTWRTPPVIGVATPTPTVGVGAARPTGCAAGHQGRREGKRKQKVKVIIEL